MAGLSPCIATRAWYAILAKHKPGKYTYLSNLTTSGPAKRIVHKTGNGNRH